METTLVLARRCAIACSATCACASLPSTWRQATSETFASRLQSPADRPTPPPPKVLGASNSTWWMPAPARWRSTPSPRAGAVRWWE